MFAPTLLPPDPRRPQICRRVALVGMLCAVWLWTAAIAPPARAWGEEPDGRRLAGYAFSVAACTPNRSWCSEVLADPTLRPLDACKALAPVFDGPRAHLRVLPGVDPKALVLAWACTPHFEAPEA